MTEVTAVILAAGEGKRMRSSRPKVLHRLCGRPIVAYPLRVARAVADRLVVVVGPQAGDLSEVLGPDVQVAEQGERLVERRGVPRDDVRRHRDVVGDHHEVIAERLRELGPARERVRADARPEVEEVHADPHPRPQDTTEHGGPRQLADSLHGSPGGRRGPPVRTQRRVLTGDMSLADASSR